MLDQHDTTRMLPPPSPAAHGSPAWQTVVRRGRAGAMAVVMSLCATQSFAGDVAERPYDPPVGSRWITETETKIDETRPDGPRSALIRIRSELTIDEKTAEGFRISYVQREATADGNDPSVTLLRSAMKTLDNIAIHATTDLTGKPVRVDNLEEARTAMRAMRDSMFEPFKDKPQLLAVFSRMFAGLTEVDAGQAATAYIRDLPELAKAQGTGMKLGEVRRTTKNANNALGGGALKSDEAFELTSADDATGKLTFVSTTTFDADSTKDFMQSLAQKLSAASGGDVNPQKIDALVASMKLSLDERAVFDVEDGMTRKISEKSDTTTNVMGQNLSRTEIKTIAVTRAP
jgi:hypothetical protein